MSRVDDYLAHARAAEAKAANLDGDYRAHLLGLARKWRDLAKIAESEIELERTIDEIVSDPSPDPPAPR